MHLDEEFYRVTRNALAWGVLLLLLVSTGMFKHWGLVVAAFSGPTDLS